MKTIGASFVIVGFLFLSPETKADTPKTKGIKSAIQKSLDLIQKSTIQYRTRRTCFSCHHQSLPLIALAEAKAKGFPIDEDNFQTQVKHTWKHLKRGQKNYLRGRGQGGRVNTAGWALWALEAGNWKKDEISSAVVEYLLKTDGKHGFWGRSGNRPPSQASTLTTTALAVIGLKNFGTKETHNRIDERMQKVKNWVIKAKVQDTEDRVFQLWNFYYLDVDKNLLREAADQLITEQNADGGWSQKTDMASDAYATGTALVALHKAAGTSVNHKSYQQGIKYLLKTQLEDGSWHVKSRSRPFQTYFESGFPHGKDQFISITASSWATQALILACNNE